MIIEDKNCEEKQNNNNENIKPQLQRENQNDFEIKTNEKTTKKNEYVIARYVRDNLVRIAQLGGKTPDRQRNERHRGTHQNFCVKHF